MKTKQCQISQEKTEFQENRNGQQCQFLFLKDQIRCELKYSFNLMTGDSWFQWSDEQNQLYLLFFIFFIFLNQL